MTIGMLVGIDDTLDRGGMMASRGQWAHDVVIAT